MAQLFQGYNMIKAPLDDKNRLQWESLQPINVLPLPEVGVLTWKDLEGFNAQINQEIRWIEPNAKDDWQQPEDTWAKKAGDCMDYAILKWAILYASWPNSRFSICLGEIKAMPNNFQHAFLVVLTPDGFVILDSKFPQVIKPKEHSFTTEGLDADYINWIPRKLLTADEVYLFARELTFADQNLTLEKP